MTRRRGAALVAAAAAAAIVLAGCSGGGGDEGADPADVPQAPVAVTPAAGAGPGESATLAIAALGSPEAAAAGRAGSSLRGYEVFGGPHDLFVDQVPEGAGAGQRPAEAPSDPPISEDPVVAVPGATGSIPTAPPPSPPAGPAPGAPSAPEEPPVQNPRAMEADFDVSGEPVVAREGDAIPPETQQFVVDTIAPDRVTLLLSGGLLPDGTNRITLRKGESITLRNATAGRDYRLKLVDVRYV